MTIKDIQDMPNDILLDKYTDIIKNGDLSKGDMFDDTVQMQQLKLEITLRLNHYDVNKSY